MNEIFWKVFQLRLSRWQAEFAATFVAYEVDFPASLFDQESAQAIREGVVRLAALPRGWKAQLSRNIIEEAQKVECGNVTL